jgi:4-amino-4-deoxy-L-arabinose transferase-like glycosyltransferase
MYPKMLLICIFFLSLVANVAFFHFFLKQNRDIYFTKDSGEYHVVATQIARGNGISNLHGEYDYNRVPGYSIFLALCYKLFNFDIEKTLYFQAIFFAIIPVLVFFLSLALFPTSVLIAKFSALIMALHFGIVLYAGSLMSENLFLIFFLLFCILFFKQKYLFGAGVLLGISSLIRPVGHFVIVIAILMLLLSKISWSKKLKHASKLLFGWCLIVLFWLIRNFSLTNEMFFHAMPGDHFLHFLALDVYCQQTLTPFDKARKKLVEECNVLVSKKQKCIGKQINRIQRCKIVEQIAFKYLKMFPFATIKRCVINVFKTMFCFYSRGILYKHLPHLVTYNYFNSVSSYWHKVKHFLFSIFSNKFLTGIVYYEILWMLFVFIGACGFFILSFFQANLFFLALKILVIIFLFLFLTVGIGFARLRLPIEPFLIVVSSYFWFHKYET